MQQFLYILATTHSLQLTPNHILQYTWLCILLHAIKKKELGNLGNHESQIKNWLESDLQ